jgi:hypothetical protein
MCRKMTAMVERWQIARGETEPPEEADELTTLMTADFGAAAPRIDEVPTEKRPGRLAALCDGYSLECRPTVAPHDRRGLARLLRYGTRPAFAQDRLSLENGRVVYALPKRFWTGQTHVVMSPVEFLRRLAALIPPRRFHCVRYHGLFSSASKHRAQACALAPPIESSTDDCEQRGLSVTDRGVAHVDATTTIPISTTLSSTDPQRDAPYRRHRRMEWARLLRQVFAIDILRCHCGGARKVIAALTRRQSPDALRRYLEHLGEPADPPPTAPARAPPQTELAFPASHQASGHTAETVDPDAVDAMPDWDAHIAD